MVKRGGRDNARGSSFCLPDVHPGHPGSVKQLTAYKWLYAFQTTIQNSEVYTLNVCNIQNIKRF